VLRTKNLPVLTDLRNWTKLFESPFKSEVYFFSTRRRVGLTFGTPQPITIRDRELGAVQVRAFGVYGFRVADAGRFHEQLSGTREVYRVADLEGQLRAILVAALAAELGGGAVPFLDLAANQPALGVAVGARAQAACEPLGVAISDVVVESLTLPDELQHRLEERIGMAVVGDLGRYAQFQTGRSIPLAAASEGGAAGAGVGVGAGVALGQTMAQAITSAAGAGGAQMRGTGGGTPGGGGGGGATPGPAGGATCPHCHATLERPTRFCPECGQSLG
jgi:membrane protease subunit (stomatin/prohibitin family)